MFTKENARHYGILGNKAQTSRHKRRGGRSKSPRKKIAARMNGTLYGGRPKSVCTCGLEEHSSRCRIYLSQKKRESRAKKRFGNLVIYKPNDPDDLSWLKYGIYPSYIKHRVIKVGASDVKTQIK